MAKAKRNAKVKEEEIDFPNSWDEIQERKKNICKQQACKKADRFVLANTKSAGYIWCDFCFTLRKVTSLGK